MHKEPANTNAHEAPIPTVRYTAAGDRSTFERDYAEVRLFKRIGAAVVIGLVILYAVTHAAGGG